MRRSLDDAPADLVHAAIEDPMEACAASCTRIDRVLEDRMALYWNLDWAVDRVAALQHALEESLRQGPYKPDEDGDKVSGS